MSYKLNEKDGLIKLNDSNENEVTLTFSNKHIFKGEYNLKQDRIELPFKDWLIKETSASSYIEQSYNNVGIRYTSYVETTSLIIYNCSKLTIED